MSLCRYPRRPALWKEGAYQGNAAGSPAGAQLFRGAGDVSRSGEVLGGLFFGHRQPGIFTARAERLLVGLAAQAAVAIDNSRLYQTSQREVRPARTPKKSCRT